MGSNMRIDDTTYRLILWGQDPETLPPLTQHQWQRWAARIYRHRRLEESRLPVRPSKGSKLPDLWLTLTETNTRLLCGSLAVRAGQLGWRSIGQQWGDRYWERAQGNMDPEPELKAAMAELRKLEHLEQSRIP